MKAISGYSRARYKLKLGNQVPSKLKLSNNVKQPKL